MNTFLDFSSLFNSEHCCDLVIHTSNDPSAAKIKCHKIVIKCASDKLYNALMANKFEPSGVDLARQDHVLIITELQNKDESAKLFINTIYDGNLILNHEYFARLDEIKDVFATYGLNGIKNAIALKYKQIIYSVGNGIGKIKPKLNTETDLSDFTIYLDKDKKYYFKTHQIILEKASQYFAGLFGSGMQESSSRESIISLDIDISPQELGTLVQDLLGFVYSNSMISMETFENMTPDTLFGISSLASKYFFTGIKAQFDKFIESTKEYPEYIIPAIKYNDTNALTFATGSLLRHIFDINLELIPVEFLTNLRIDDGKTIFHAVLSGQRRGALTSLHQIQVLEKMLGPNSPISLKTKDDHGNNCLHEACKTVLFNTNSEVIELMIARNFDLNERNANGDCPLQLAIKHRYHGQYFETFFQEPNADETPDPLTIIEKMIMAGATVNVDRIEDLDALISHACRCRDNSSDEAWKIVTGELDKVDKDKLKDRFSREYRDIMLANAYKKPIHYFFGKRNIPYQITGISRNKADKTVIQFKVADLNQIEIHGVQYKFKDVTVTRYDEILVDHNNYPSYAGFELSMRNRTFFFQPSSNNSAYNLVAGLVYVVVGKKNLRTAVKRKKNSWE